MTTVVVRSSPDFRWSPDSAMFRDLAIPKHAKRTGNQDPVASFIGVEISDTSPRIGINLLT